MNTINVTYNINSDEVIRQVDDTMRRITEITKSNSSEQVRLMTEVYSSLTAILDNYMNNVRNQFSTYIDIAKNTWEMASSDAKDYFDDLVKKQDMLNDKFKLSTDSQLQLQRDALREKLEFTDRETKASLESIEKKEEAEKKLAENKKKLREITEGIDSTLGSVSHIGGLGSTTNSILKMGGDLVGGALNIASGLNMGQGVKDIVRVVTEGIGMLIESVEHTDNLKKEIITASGLQGIDKKSAYDSELSYTNSESLISKLKKTADAFPTVSELTEMNQMQTIKGFAGSRQFGEDTDYHKLGLDATLIGKSRGLGSSEVTNLFIEMKQKLNEPLENLTGRFFQLDNISKDLGINLKDVIRGYQQLMNENLKYGYSQEQLMGFYSTFGQELKEGTVSVSQLSEYMRGLAGMGTDKSVGVVSLLMANKEETLKNFSGDKGTASKLFDILGGADNELDQAQIFRMMQNPEADYSNDPFLSGIMKKNNLTPDVLRQMKPVSQQLISGTSLSMANQSGEGLGAGRLIEEQLMKMMGMSLSDNLYDSGKQQKMINTFGTRKGVMGLDEAKNEGHDVISNQFNILKELTPYTAMIEAELEAGLEKTASITEETWKRTNGNLKETMDAMYESIKQQGDHVLHTLSHDKMDVSYDKFTGSVDKFEHAVGTFSKVLNFFESANDFNHKYNPIQKGIDFLFSGDRKKDDWDLFGLEKKGELFKVVEGLERAKR